MQRHLRSAQAPWIVLVSGLALTGVLGCGDSSPGPYGPGPYETIGLDCGSDFDCAPGARCGHGPGFGPGTCTYACLTHAECPPGTACVDMGGGACMTGCANDRWCPDGFHCMPHHDRSGPGESLVCVR
jgi:hypothetical protein